MSGERSFGITPSGQVQAVRVGLLPPPASLTNQQPARPPNLARGAPSSPAAPDNSRRWGASSHVRPSLVTDMLVILTVVVVHVYVFVYVLCCC